MVREQFADEYDSEKLLEITPQKRNFKMLVTPRFKGHFCDNTYEDFTSDLLLNLTKDNMLFIDIGAHYGYYTILIGTKYPGSRIIAFEPVPENFEILKRNVALNQLRNAELYNMAVSDSDGSRKFKMTEASDSCGFYEHPLANTCKEIDVQTVCLDHFFREIPNVPVIVKIDAEGHEPYILQGMKKLINHSENVKLIIEFNPKCLINAGYSPTGFLKDIFQLGFDVYAIDDPGRKIYKVDADHFNGWAEYLPRGDENGYINLLWIKREVSLNVLFFSHSSLLAGAERTLLELARRLINDYGVVCSVALPNDGPLRKKLEDIGASTLILDYSWWCDSTPVSEAESEPRLSRNSGKLFHNLRELRKINPDVIMTITLVIPWGALAAYFLGKPHVWSIHEFIHEFHFFLPAQKILEIVEGSSNIVVTNSNATRELHFGKAAPGHILTVYSSITIPSGAASKCDQKYFKRKNAIKLLSYSTLAQKKVRWMPY